MDDFCLHRGDVPLLISLPHDGTELPFDVAARMTPDARRVPDTDWHVGRLYEDLARTLGASLLRPTFSRYLVDLNRSPDDVSLYPGRNTTGLCPAVQFSGAPVYLEGQAPTPEEIARRVRRWWRPYHDTLAAELERLRVRHGRVLLWEGHSIRSELPFLFPGRLPDVNLGTASGASCRPELQAALQARLAAQREFTWVVNGRFKGGYITRHYGRPDAGVDAVQLELAQCIYLDEHSAAWNAEGAARTRALILDLLRCALS